MICSVSANFAMLYKKYQNEFWKAVYFTLKNSLLFTEINKQIGENVTRGKMAGM